MSMIKSGLYLAISTAIKVVLGIISIKVISYYIGASGFGLLGQFMSLMSVIAITAGGGISNGIISKVAHFKEDTQKINKIISAGFWISIIFSAVLALLLFFFSNFLSQQLFEKTDYSIVIKIMAIFQLFNIFTVLYGGYLNGLQRSKFFSILTVVSAILGTLGLVILVHFFKLSGAMLGLIWLAISPGLIFLAAYFFKSKHELKIYGFSITEKIYVKSLLKYSSMLLFSACLMPISQIWVRRLIFENSGWEEVGYWQAASKLSESGLVFLNVIMVNYYLPEIGKCTNNELLKKVISKTYLILIPIVSLYVIVVYLLKSFLIPLFFNPTFTPAEPLLVWQIIGDAFKVLCLVYGFLIVLKEKIKTYFFFELLIFICLTFFSYLLIPNYGTIGANYAYTLAYFLSFVIGLIFLNYYIKNENNS